MTFLQARNAITDGLEAHLGCPVVLSEQIADMPDFPYCYYSVLTTRITDHAYGLKGLKVLPDDKYARTRSEPVDATMSFTFCGANRDTEDGGYIFGENEALGLAEKGHGFFLLNAHNIDTEYGDIVMKTVGSVANRSGFFVEDTIRRYGFDVRFSYVRTDEMPTTTILNAGNPIGEVQA